MPSWPVRSANRLSSTSLNRSTMPSSPKPGLGWPVFASSDTSWNPGVTTMMRPSLAVGPVRDGAMNLARRSLEAGAFVRPPRPQRFAGGGVGGDDGTPLPGGEIEHAVHHDRRRLGRHRLGGRAEVVELPRPRDLQVLDVVASDLIEWRVPGAPLVVAVAAPFSRRVERHSDHRRNAARRARRRTAREACATDAIASSMNLQNRYEWQMLQPRSRITKGPPTSWPRFPKRCEAHGCSWSCDPAVVSGGAAAPVTCVQAHAILAATAPRREAISREESSSGGSTDCQRIGR